MIYHSSFYEACTCKVFKIRLLLANLLGFHYPYSQLKTVVEKRVLVYSGKGLPGDQGSYSQLSYCV